MRTMDNVKRRIITSMVAILLLIITIFGITYAYFVANVRGNEEDKSISVSAGILELTYMDGNGVLNLYKYLIPGESVTFKDKDGKEVSEKTFSVENTGTKLIEDYEVVLENLKNELEYYEDLTYTLECRSSIEGKSCNGSSGVFLKTNGVLVENSIEAKEIHYYTLKLEYHETNKDQSKDMNKNISAKINIRDNESELKGLIVYGNSVQEGVPTVDNPVLIKSVGDKTINILENKSKSKTINGVTFTINNDGSITMNGTNTGTDGIVFPINTDETLVRNVLLEGGKTYTLSHGATLPKGIYFQAYYYENSNPLYKTSPVSFSLSSNVDATFYIRFDVGVTANNITIYPQLEESSIINEYEPYGYKIPVKVSNKNLWNSGDANVYQSYTYHLDNVLLAGETYTFSATVTSNDTDDTKCLVYDATNNKVISTIRRDTRSSFQFIPTADTNRIALYASTSYNNSLGDNVTFKDIQIEKGTEMTNYEPYINETYNIYLDEPLRKVGDVADYIDFYNYRLVRNIKVIDDTGTKPIEESFEVLDLPIQESIELPSVIRKNIANIEIDTSVEPSKIEY